MLIERLMVSSVRFLMISSVLFRAFFGRFFVILLGSLPRAQVRSFSRSFSAHFSAHSFAHFSALIFRPLSLAFARFPAHFSLALLTALRFAALQIFAHYCSLSIYFTRSFSALFRSPLLSFPRSFPPHFRSALLCRHPSRADISSSTPALCAKSSFFRSLLVSRFRPRFSLTFGFASSLTFGFTFSLTFGFTFLLTSCRWPT